MILKNFKEVPPNGYRYVVPETGTEIIAWDAFSWFDLAKANLTANGFPVPDDLEAQMQDQLCQTLEPQWCDQVDPNRPVVSTRISWSDVKAGISVYSSWLASGMATVPQEEADRRAKICASCFLNVNVEGCYACHKLAGLLTWSNRTPYDESLRACAACHCLNRAQVWFPIATLETSDTVERQVMYPSFCWKQKKSENYLPG